MAPTLWDCSFGVGLAEGTGLGLERKKNQLIINKQQWQNLRDSPTLSVLRRASFPLLDQKEVASLDAFSAHAKLYGRKREQKIPAVLRSFASVCWFPSPINLPPFTFESQNSCSMHSAQVLLSCTGRACLLHLTWTWNQSYFNKYWRPYWRQWVWLVGCSRIQNQGRDNSGLS